MPGATRGTLVEASDRGGLTVVAQWPSSVDAPFRDDALASHVIARGGAAWRALGATMCCVAHAYRASSGTPGALLLRVRVPASEHARACDLSGKIARAMWSTDAPSPSDARAPTAPSCAPSDVRFEARSPIDWAEVVAACAAATAHVEPTRNARALVLALAERLQCDRVSLGLLSRDGTMHVRASAPALDRATARGLLEAIASALDEGAAQGGLVAYPTGDDAVPRIVAAHAALARVGSAQSIVTVALSDAHEARAVGALCFERSSAPFTSDDHARIRRFASVLGPMLALQRHVRIAPTQRIAMRLRRGLAARGIAPRHAAWGAAAVVALMVTLVATVPVGYRIAAPARVEGVVQRALVAPTDGFLDRVHVRPGDRVQRDAVLAELSRADLALSERKLSGELAQAESAYGTALAQHDRAQIMMQLARSEEAAAQLALVREALARAVLRAPFDGVVLEGDLSQSLGAPVKRGDVLMRIAPLEAWRVIVDIDERDIDGIALGATGSVILTAQPGASLAVTVVRITPVATARDGRTFYEVEAQVTGRASASVRPGMTGVAKLDAGARTLAWSWSHRIVDRVRYAVWTWTG